MVKIVGYVIVSIAGGILFLLMDVLIKANPLAQKLYDFYEPIARTSVNAPAGTLIYTLITGLLEMLVLGVLCGATLEPKGER